MAASYNGNDIGNGGSTDPESNAVCKILPLNIECTSENRDCISADTNCKPEDSNSKSKNTDCESVKTEFMSEDTNCKSENKELTSEIPECVVQAEEDTYSKAIYDSEPKTEEIYDAAIQNPDSSSSEEADTLGPDPGAISKLNRRLSCKELEAILENLNQITRQPVQLPTNDRDAMNCRLRTELSREDAAKTIDNTIDRVKIWAEDMRRVLKEHANSHFFTDKRNNPGRRQTSSAVTPKRNDSGIFSEDVGKAHPNLNIESLKERYLVEEEVSSKEEVSSSSSNECNVCSSACNGCNGCQAKDH